MRECDSFKEGMDRVEFVPLHRSKEFFGTSKSSKFILERKKQLKYYMKRVTNLPNLTTYRSSEVWYFCGLHHHLKFVDEEKEIDPQQELFDFILQHGDESSLDRFKRKAKDFGKQRLSAMEFYRYLASTFEDLNGILSLIQNLLNDKTKKNALQQVHEQSVGENTVMQVVSQSLDGRTTMSEFRSYSRRLSKSEISAIEFSDYLRSSFSQPKDILAAVAKAIPDEQKRLELQQLLAESAKSRRNRRKPHASCSDIKPPRERSRLSSSSVQDLPASKINLERRKSKTETVPEEKEVQVDNQIEDEEESGGLLKRLQTQGAVNLMSFRS